MLTKQNRLLQNNIKHTHTQLGIGIVLFLLIFTMLCPGLALAEPYDHSESLKIEPIFSMDEPWTLKGFGEKFSKMTCMKTCEEAADLGLGKQYSNKCEYGDKQKLTDYTTNTKHDIWWINGDFVQDFQKKSDCIKSEDLKLEQGKTVKNKQGKAYFLTAAKEYADYGYAILGLRDMSECEGECAESYDVQFYLMSTDSDYRTFIKQWGSVYRTSTQHEVVDIYRLNNKTNMSAITFVEFDFIFTGEWNCGHPEEDNPKKM